MVNNQLTLVIRDTVERPSTHRRPVKNQGAFVVRCNDPSSFLRAEGVTLPTNSKCCLRAVLTGMT